MLLRNSALRIQLLACFLFSFLSVFGLPERSFCVTDRHTIVIDGVNDFFSDEKHETTSSASGYFAYLTWDTDNLYLGCEGFYVGDPGGQRWVVWYLDTADGEGTQTTFEIGTQQPALPDEFFSEYMILWACDNTQLTVNRFEGGDWILWPAPTDHFLSGNYMEMSIPWEWLNTPDILKVVSSHIKEDVPEWTYAGLPADTFVDGYDPDFSTYLTAFSGMGTGDLHVSVLPDTLDAPWQINGPNNFFQEGGGTAFLTYLEPGEYSVTWGEVTGWETPPPEIATLDAGEIITFQGVYEEINGAAILGIDDVPGDQGGQVRISWSRSRFDAQGEVVVTGYEIYRKEPSLKIAGWDFVALVPAHWDSIYETIAPTLCDSTITGGLCWSTFMIRAATESPGVFFDSHPDSGYSVDNLVPTAPTGLIVADEVLSWDEPTDADFDYFSVYGSSSPELGPDAVLIGYTTGTIHVHIRRQPDLPPGDGNGLRRERKPGGICPLCIRAARGAGGRSCPKITTCRTPSTPKRPSPLSFLKENR